MGLKHANFCTVCGKVRTRHSSGICQRCRANPTPKHRTPCKICTTTKTSHESGICAACRKKAEKLKNADTRSDIELGKYDVLLKYSAVLRCAADVLDMRHAGYSFDMIAEQLGVPKSTCYSWFKRALGLPNNTSDNGIITGINVKPTAKSNDDWDDWDD